MANHYRLARHGRTFTVALLITFALTQWGRAAWIHGKAILAQHLIKDSWQQTLAQPASANSHKPWPWADTWPVARLQWLTEADLAGVLEVKSDYFVLSGAHGSALAFGPGHVDGTALPGFGASVIGGHRDTHFSFLKYVSPGDRLRIQNIHGQWKIYLVKTTEVVDSTKTPLKFHPHRDTVWLVTCYPFNAVTPGGLMRYVVRADVETASNIARL